MTNDDLDLDLLLPLWINDLRSRGRSVHTVAQYRGDVGRYFAWCASHDRPAAITRASVTAWTADCLEAGLAATTVRTRQAAVRQLSAFLAAEDSVPDPLAGLKPPRVVVTHTPRLTDDQIGRLLRACAGPAFADLRDTAITRLMIETGLRAGEAVALEVADTDITAGIAVVRRGKGGKARKVAFGPPTAMALGRYLRARKTHRLAHTPALWLGERGATLRYEGLRAALRRRAEAAGIGGFHVHITRHTFAQRFLDAGGNDSDLMTVAGWSDRNMIDRYTRATAQDRALEATRKLNLGDL